MVDERIFSKELNLISPDTGSLKWVVGVYQKDTYYFQPGKFVIGVPPGSRRPSTCWTAAIRRHVWAGFGQITFDLSERVKLEFGGRYEKHRTANDVNVVQYGLPIADVQEAEYTNFSGKAALNWT